MLSRHLEVLEMVLDDGPMGIVKMSNETGYPHHKIRYSLRVLEENDLITPTKRGAVTTEQASEFVGELDGEVESLAERLEQMKSVTSWN